MGRINSQYIFALADTQSLKMKVVSIAAFARHWQYGDGFCILALPGWRNVETLVNWSERARCGCH